MGRLRTAEDKFRKEIVNSNDNVKTLIEYFSDSGLSLYKPIVI